MSPEPGTTGASLKDHVLEAIASFLSECGLDSPAEVLREEVRVDICKPRDGSTGGSFSLRVRSLVTILTRLVNDPGLSDGADALLASELQRPVPASPSSKSEKQLHAQCGEEDCLDAEFLRIASCEEHLSLDKELTARLHQALASRRTATVLLPDALDHAAQAMQATAAAQAGRATQATQEVQATEASGLLEPTSPVQSESTAAQQELANPDRVAEEQKKEKEEVAVAEVQPSPVKAADPPPRPSEHYVPKRLAGPSHPFVDEMPDEYRDDNDPGYRIREVTDAELLAEMQEKYAMQLAAHAAAAGHPPSEASPNAGAAGASAEASPSPQAADDDELMHAGQAREKVHAKPEDTAQEARDKVHAKPEDAAQEASADTPASSSSSLKGFVKSAGAAMLAAFGVKGSPDSEAEGASPGSPGAASEAPGDGAGSDDKRIHVGNANGNDIVNNKEQLSARSGADTSTATTSQSQPSLAATAAAVMTSANVDAGRTPVSDAVPTFGAPDSQKSTEDAAGSAGEPPPAAPVAGEAARAAAQAAAQLQMQVAQVQAMQLMQEEQLAALSGSLPVEAGAQPAQATAQQQAAQAYLAPTAQMQAAAAAQAAAAQAVAAQRASQVVALPHALANKRKKRNYKRVPYRYAASGDPFYPVELDGTVFDSFSLRVVFERDRTGFEESKEFPIRMNSIVAARYQVLEYLGSAAFSKAVQCLDLQTQKMVCMKIIKNDKDFLDQSLDEIKLLKLINVNVENVDDKHCLRLIDYFYHKEHLIIVTELLRDNLYEFSKFNRDCGDEPFFTLGHLQRITKQVLIALEYIHSLWLIHADLKPENILVKSYSRCEVKVIDFGSSCFVDDHLSSYVQSRSYRAPEVMLGLPYDQKVDIWSLGCIVAELWTGYVLFQNDSIQSMLARIIGIIGSFDPKMLVAGRFVSQYFTQDGRLFREVETAVPGPPGTCERHIQIFLPKQSSLRQRMRTNDKEFVNFLSCLLKLDPTERLSAKDALQHPWLAPGRYSDGL